MLACVCQPSDGGIFSRSPIPLGAPPLQAKGAIPKRSRVIQNPCVITTEPSTKTIQKYHRSNKKTNRISKRTTSKSIALDTTSGSSSSLNETLSSTINNVSKDKPLHAEIGVNISVTKTKINCVSTNELVTNTKTKLETIGCESRNTSEDKCDDLRKLPEGVQLTLSELREMACRQQAQIDSQHQLLAAKEQRLRYLKDQEARQQRVQAETERLRRLRDRVDAQELKLRKLRALRGQVDHHKQNNISLTSDLESIRALFNEKEKELSLAVAKVEELTRQLEELRRGRSRDQEPPASALELDKLRRELMYRNKLNEQQNQRLNQQREALTARQEEMSSIDKRISELQERLHRKRLLNQQLATQISAASNKTAYQQLVRLTGSTDQGNQFYGRKPQHISNGLSRGNIATVEPYNHVPLPNGHSIKAPHCGIQDTPTYHPVYQQNHHIINAKSDAEQQMAQDQEELNKLANHYVTRGEEADALKEFSVSKSDPKYQTLPYNTKFTVNLISNRVNNRISENNDNNVDSNANKDVEQVPHISTSSNIQSQHMTVHSAPLSVINKNIATPLNQNDLLIRKNSEIQNTIQSNPNVHSNHDINNQVNKYQSQDINTSANNPTSPSYQKPISSVAPTSVQHSAKLSTIYQSSSIKVQPVEPQTISNTQKHLPAPPPNSTIQSPQSIALSPPQANSTPLGTPETISDKIRPALPPKPAIKPPPRQTQANSDPDQTPLSSDPPDDNKLHQSLNHRIAPQPPSIQSKLAAYNQTVSKTPMQNQTVTQPSIDNMPIIKAKPLTIKKQPISEQPKLRNSSSISKLNGYISNSRRIEIPPAFHFDSNVDTPTDTANVNEIKDKDEVDKVATEDADSLKEKPKEDTKHINDNVVRRCKKGNLKQTGKANLSRRVSFDPLALLLDASLEGELELVKKTAGQVPNPSAANDEGITALHNAICAGHFEIVKFLVEFGCDVNAQDSDGWTPLHCAASCNNVAMVKFLVEHGACIFATTLSDHETAAEKCEEDEEGFDGCSEYLYSVQEKLGILSGGIVYAVFDYTAQQPDELSFNAGQQLTVLRKGDESEREWWWSRLDDKEGYIPRNLLGLYPRVCPKED